MNKKQNTSFKQVKELNIPELEQAISKGTLYILQEENQVNNQEEGIRQTLQYVSRIDDCTSSVYCTRIHEIWESILRDERLTPLFFFQRYKHNRGQINWYRVTVVVCMLRELGVYRQEFTAVELHLILECKKHRNVFYTSMNRYALDTNQRSLIRQIVKYLDSIPSNLSIPGQ